MRLDWLLLLDVGSAGRAAEAGTAAGAVPLLRGAEGALKPACIAMIQPYTATAARRRGGAGRGRAATASTKSLDEEQKEHAIVAYPERWDKIITVSYWGNCQGKPQLDILSGSEMSTL